MNYTELIKQLDLSSPIVITIIVLGLALIGFIGFRVIILLSIVGFFEFIIDLIFSIVDFIGKIFEYAIIGLIIVGIIWLIITVFMKNGLL